MLEQNSSDRGFTLQQQVELRFSEIDSQLASGMMPPPLQKQLQMEKYFLKSLGKYHKLKNTIFQNFNGYLDKQFSSTKDNHYYDRSFFKKEKPKRADNVGLLLLRWTNSSFKSSRSSTIGKF